MNKRINIYYCILIALLGISQSCKDDEQIPLEANFTSNKQTIIAGNTINFMDQSTGNPVRWDWTFEGGEPNTSNLFSPEVVYTKPGTYTVILKIGRGTDNSEKEIVQYITVNYPDEITPGFSVNKTQALSNEKVSFTDLSIGFPSAWSWEFISKKGIKVTSSEQSPSLFFESGVYTVKLTVTNPNASASLVKEDYLTVLDKDDVGAAFTANKKMVIEGTSIEFKDMSIGRATNWQWTFEGATTATSKEQNPVVTYSKAGKYKVTLKASNEVNYSIVEEIGYVVVLPSKDVVLFYPFDGNGEDMGPNNIQPQIIKKGNGAIDFNALARHDGFYCALFSYSNSTDYAFLSLPDNSVLDFQATAVTTSFWIKTNNTVSTYLSVFQQGTGPNVRTDGTNRQTWCRLQSAKSPYVRYGVEYTGLSSNWSDYKTQSLSDGKWHHYACIYTGVSTYLYIDGVKVAESLNKDSKVIDSTPYLIGAMYRGAEASRSYENFMDGCIDDYVVYHRVLTVDEIKSLYELTK